MNGYEIDMAVDRHSRHPLLGRATRFLRDYRDMIDANSDGWAYWTPARLAARRLMEMIQHPATATEETFKQALTPIKSFCTRRKLVMPNVDDNGSNAFHLRIMEDIGRAVEILYHLDIGMSNAYTGNKEQDKPIVEMRKHLKAAMDNLRSDIYFTQIKELP